MRKSKTVQWRSEKLPLCVQTKAKNSAAPMKAMKSVQHKAKAAAAKYKRCARTGYLLFAAERRRLAKRFGEDLDMADVGLEWRSLSASDQKGWKEEAAALREA